MTYFVLYKPRERITVKIGDLLGGEVTVENHWKVN